MRVCSIIFFLWLPRLPRSTLFPYTTLFRSVLVRLHRAGYLHRRFRDRLHIAVERHQAEFDLKIRMSLPDQLPESGDRKSTRLNSSHVEISYAVFCLKKKVAFLLKFYTLLSL